MHLVRYQVAISIDGFIAPKDGSTAWLEPYGGIATDFLGPWMKQIGGIIVGRDTYEQSLDMGGWTWGETPTLVMTSRPMSNGMATVETSDDPVDGLKRLRARMPKGDIWLYGGGVTAGAFLKANLIDLLEPAVVPVALGAGRPLFSGVETELTFEHTSAQPIGLGCVVNTYTRIGGVTRPERRS